MSKIGLALGSGGSRGLVHIGIIKALEKHGIKPDIVTGTSVGAIIGGMYSYKSDILAVENFWKEFGRRDLMSVFVEPSLSPGFIKGDKAQKLIEQYVGNVDITDTKLRFGAVATNLKTGQPAYFTNGRLSAMIRASSSIPAIVAPYKYDGNYYVDGGLCDPVPVQLARDLGAEKVIAVNLDAELLQLANNYVEDSMNVVSITKASISLLRHHLAHMNVKDADVVIEPELPNGNISLTAFIDAEKRILEGELHINNIIDSIKYTLAH